MLRRAAFLLLTLTLSIPLLAKDALIPISAVANGANNTIFRSDVRIFNPSDSDPLVVTATFLKANNDNTSAASKADDGAEQHRSEFLQYHGPRCHPSVRRR